MDVAALLSDEFNRVRPGVHAVLAGLGADQLAQQPAPGANSIGWLIWHLTRIQDDQIANVAGDAQVYTAQGFATRFALPYPVTATGYGQSAAQVAEFHADGALLGEYYDAVHTHTLAYLAPLRPADLDRIVDPHWDPPVSLGVRLVSTLADNLEHLGQAAYVRGLPG